VFRRVTIAVSDRDASERFYDLVLATLALGTDGFSISQAADDDAVTRRLHIGFTAPSREHVDAFWRAGLEAGYRDDGAPGPRPQYVEDYYGGFLHDPDGNSAEAVHYGAMPGVRPVDHLWIRVADVSASRRFYERFAGQAGLRLREEGRVQFSGRAGSMSLVSGEPTRNAQLAFPAAADARLLDPDGNVIELVKDPRRVS